MKTILLFLIIQSSLFAKRKAAFLISQQLINIHGVKGAMPLQKYYKHQIPVR